MVEIMMLVSNIVVKKLCWEFYEGDNKLLSKHGTTYGRNIEVRALS